MNEGYNNLWPSTVRLGKIENQELLEEFCQAIFNEVDLNRPLGSVFQGYDLLRDGPEVMQQFRDQVVWPVFKEMLDYHGVDLNDFPDRRVRSWITGAKAGYMIPAHNHNGASYSAVFYLIAEEQNAGGELVILDPRANANRGYKDQFKPLFENVVYKPQSGEFLVFPSYLYHHTIPFGGSLRLAMPVDLFL
jgi:hypothetical protein